MQLIVQDKPAYINTGGVPWQPDQPWLCLVHGAALDHSVWVLFTRYFARQGYNVVVPDLPGHGRSAGEAPETIESMADWLLDVLDAAFATLGPDASAAAEKATSIVGHSMGSLAALQAAASRPGLFSHLVLLGTSVPMPVGDALLDAARDNHQASIDMVSIFGHAFQSRLGGNPVAGINILESAMALLAAAPPGVMYRGLSACNNYSGGLQAAAAVSARATLILGEKDMMTPPVGAVDVHKALGPEAGLITLSECGHMMLAEQPEKTLQSLLEALA